MTRAEAIKCIEEDGIRLGAGDFVNVEALKVAVECMKEQNVTDTNVGNKWISVKEDLPKKLGHYFIAYKFDGSDMRFYGEAMFHPEGSNGLVDRPHFSNEGVDGMYVTHWMKIPKLPLSEPPKEDAE